MKSIVLVTLVLTLQLPHGARAQPACPDQASYPAGWPVASLPVSSAPLPYESNPLQKLYRLSTQLRKESAAASINDAQKRALQRLSHFIQGVLRDYDPADANTARWLSANDVRPRSCPATFDEDDNPIATCAWATLYDPPLEVPARGASDAWDCTFEHTFAGYVRSTSDLLATLQTPHIIAAADSLKRYDQAWQNLITNGYSQTPLEVWINGAWINEENWGPSPNFMIFLHPALGAGVSNITRRHDSDAAAVAILSVEALGYLRYFSNHRQYVGAGLTGTLGNFQWDQKGLGVVAHLSGFSLGLTRGFTGQNDKDWSVFWLLDVGRSFDDGLLARKVPQALTDASLRR